MFSFFQLFYFRTLFLPFLDIEDLNLQFLASSSY